MDNGARYADVPQNMRGTKPCKPTSYALLDGAMAAGWAGMAYIVVLKEFLMLSFVADAPVAIVLVVSCTFAQAISFLTIWCADDIFGYRRIHLHSCRRTQSVYAFVAWLSQCSFVFGALAAVLTFCLCPAFLLWHPMKRPSAAPQQIVQAPADPAKRRRRGDPHQNPARRINNLLNRRMRQPAWRSDGRAPATQPHQWQQHLSRLPTHQVPLRSASAHVNQELRQRLRQRRAPTYQKPARRSKIAHPHQKAWKSAWCAPGAMTFRSGGRRGLHSLN